MQHLRLCLWPDTPAQHLKLAEADASGPEPLALHAGEPATPQNAPGSVSHCRFVSSTPRRKAATAAISVLRRVRRPSMRNVPARTPATTSTYPRLVRIPSQAFHGIQIRILEGTADRKVEKRTCTNPRRFQAGSGLRSGGRVVVRLAHRRALVHHPQASHLTAPAGTSACIGGGRSRVLDPGGWETDASGPVKPSLLASRQWSQPPSLARAARHSPH